MATTKQKEAARKNIKKAQAANARGKSGAGLSTAKRNELVVLVTSQLNRPPQLSKAPTTGDEAAKQLSLERVALTDVALAP